MNECVREAYDSGKIRAGGTDGLPSVTSLALHNVLRCNTSHGVSYDVTDKCLTSAYTVCA